MNELRPLHDEHHHIAERLVALRATADAVGMVPPGDLRRAIDEVLQFLDEHLLPHAAAEDEVLYPFVGHLLGSPLATATMRRDHSEILGLAHELQRLRDRLGDAAATDLRRVLYSLFAVVRLHLAKEDEIYLPLLESRLSAEQAAGLLEGLASAETTEATHH